MDKNHLVSEEENEVKSLNFIEQIMEEELAEGKNGGRVHTRFPPEPNGYLHIGHATSICLNFGLAAKYNGKCNLRFDDTNPSKEDVEYIDSILGDIRWLGFQWEGEPHYASDYFQQLYDWAEKMIMEGKAYVDDQPAEAISAQRMTPTEPGVNSPYRDRTPEENLDLFRRMKSGEFQAGEKVLRAKIDMASSNMLMRDPIMYRIMHVAHHRTGDQWCIYPMYDFTHGQSDYLEGITHSICTLEFEVHRPLYNWFLDQLIETEYRPRQIEFARRNLSYTVMSKRRLLELVQKGIVAGWDDPRMPTISGLRRAGYTPESIRNFAEKVGVARREIVVDMALLEFCIREHLNKVAPRVMAVLDPVKVVIDNYPQGQTEYVEIENNPEDESAGTRAVPFSGELYIERDDFMENAPKKFFRMTIGNEVRLKGAYIVKCESVEKDEEGNVTTIHCTYDPDTRSGSGINSNRKVKGTLHWVSAAEAIDAEVRLYDRLFKDPDPAGHKDIDFKEFLNENSLKVLTRCKLEPSLKEVKEGDRFQFQRLGYFCVDKDSQPGKLVFNRTVGLKDTWAKQNS
ncbi:MULTISPECIES: glutamine--tRNA ligase/YqeY domain fusion protein [Sanguibacteroides]|uniref:Glutamine--tRNA ligase n=1 Tax=Sanguibacteroides justesenii TaxID=1547597 RepID=A0A0C3R5H9_9PORP|nr:MULTISPECIES: glutamine--tRNA ligase/YqeY domain fusion protein [Sanguibacteroides]KIO43209.1 glutamate--tRNA ligase [Sanguibacteroides justesenii]KIO44925.1 glutamate--tRNA ligase [Sanguibacteroides justesenii]PXZ43145.1 glutamine--tRNA ligase/YqeY domain fusion protein [Sanguibacteroides justesenii]